MSSQRSQRYRETNRQLSSHDRSYFERERAGKTIYTLVDLSNENILIINPETKEYEPIENPNISPGGGAGIQSAQLMS